MLCYIEFKHFMSTCIGKTSLDIHIHIHVNIRIHVHAQWPESLLQEIQHMVIIGYIVQHNYIVNMFLIKDRRKSNVA